MKHNQDIFIIAVQFYLKSVGSVGKLSMFIKCTSYTCRFGIGDSRKKNRTSTYFIWNINDSEAIVELVPFDRRCTTIVALYVDIKPNVVTCKISLEVYALEFIENKYSVQFIQVFNKHLYVIVNWKSTSIHFFVYKSR